MRYVSAIAVFAAVVFVGASDASSSAGGMRVIKVYASYEPGDARSHDAPPRGVLSKGDRWSVDDVLTNAAHQYGRPKGAVVGRDRFTVVVDRDRSAMLTQAVTLPGGMFRCRGRNPISSFQWTLRVVSGTGAFEGATGTCVGHEVGPTRMLNVYRLSR